MKAKSRYLNCNGAEIHFMEWGQQNEEAVMMWHGLARTGRDFDELAEALALQWRIICPDSLGRGLSQWANNREKDYQFSQYCQCAIDLLDQLQIENVRWVGTSMGGMIGMDLAANALKHRMTHLMLNDIGPGEISDEAVARIAEYVGNPPKFKTVTELEKALRTIYAPFGSNSDEYWQRMLETSVRRTADGMVTMHYDPMIATMFTTHKSDLDLWPIYEQIECPTLLFRGENSDVLSVDVAEKMTQRGPKAQLENISACGHAPTLNTPYQIEKIRTFFQS